MLGSSSQDVAGVRSNRIRALRGALAALADADAVIADDMDVVFDARPPANLLERGTWHYESEQKLVSDLRSVADRLAGLVYRLEREHTVEARPVRPVSSDAA